MGVMVGSGIVIVSMLACIVVLFVAGMIIEKRRR